MPREAGSSVMDVLPQIGRPCKVVSAPIASILPQSSNSNSSRLWSFLMEVGSFSKFLHPVTVSDRSCDSRPIDLGSFLMGQHRIVNLFKLVIAPRFLGNLVRCRHLDSSRVRSTFK
ncbi:hypothetical protein KC19_4G051200 [Ceratodon purpureus]|uniref:Uncharacterized protein n=1 Tax=Ceratodon purpureus TaxID=3225 RepID=A0A8T0I5U7_CERPU|nr:hypothetical protein KC19_4G051200 [Ceratodon purpureus]